LTWENLPTTACWFIEASTALVQAIATKIWRPIFWQRGIAVFAASLCYAKITPPRCTAAVSMIAAVDVPKLLHGRQNSSWAILEASSPAKRRRR